jgi:hypothetical protein
MILEHDRLRRSPEIAMPKMSAIDLKALLAAERYDVLSAMAASKLSDERASALNYYMGDMSKDMPAADARSKAVSSDVADTIEGLMPPLMDISAGGDEVVQFAPVGPEDVPAAEQETDYVNHVFMQQNNGFLVLYSFIRMQRRSEPKPTSEQIEAEIARVAALPPPPREPTLTDVIALLTPDQQTTLRQMLAAKPHCRDAQCDNFKERFAAVASGTS